MCVDVPKAGTLYSHPSPAPKLREDVYHFVATTFVPEGWNRASETHRYVSLVTRWAMREMGGFMICYLWSERV